MKTIKQIITVVALAIFMLNPTSGNAQNSSSKTAGFWDTLLVDAGGALGGAGSVASIIGPASSTPLGIAGVVAGGVLGGASASVAYNKSASPSKEQKQFNIKDIKVKNLNNKNEDVGKNHNKIIIDFYQENSTFRKDVFYNFFKNNKTYNKGSFVILQKKEYDRIVEKAISFKSSGQDAIINNILLNLPKKINKKWFNEQLRKSLKNTDIVSLIKDINRFENQLNSKFKLTKVDKVIIDCFFSTFKNSALLW